MSYRWSLLLTLLLLLAVGSCGGSSTLTSDAGINPPANGSDNTDTLDARFQQWLDQQALIGGTPDGLSDLPPLPIDMGDKTSSEGDDGGGSGNKVVLGKDFMAENGATVEGDSATLFVENEDNGPAYALYKFSGLLNTRPLSLNVECVPAGWNDRYWIGVADYTNYTWRWFGPSMLPEYQINLAELDWNFITNLGNMYFVIVLQGGMTATHSQSTLVYGPNEPPSFPGCPTELVASDGEFFEGVALTWHAAHGAEWYRILRRVHVNQDGNGGDGEGGSEGGEWHFIGESVETNFFDHTAEPGVVYDYKVEARNESGHSCFSNIDTGFAAEHNGGGEFDLFGAFVEEGTAVVLEWGGPDVEIFTVWKRIGDGEFQPIVETDDHRYVDHNVEKNVHYAYKVSYTGPDGGVFFSNIVELFYQGGNEEGFVLGGHFAEENTVVVLEWTTRESHTGYDVFRRLDGQEYQFIGETLDNHFVDPNVETGVHYFYKVKAYRGGMEPEWSNELHLFAEGEGGGHDCDLHLEGHFNEAGTAVFLSWSDHPDHTGYLVQKRIGDGEWFNLGDTDGNAWVDEEVGPGVWYSYRVKAFRGENIEPCVSNVIELFREGEGGDGGDGGDGGGDF